MRGRFGGPIWGSIWGRVGVDLGVELAICVKQGSISGAMWGGMGVETGCDVGHILLPEAFGQHCNSVGSVYARRLGGRQGVINC